MWGVGGLTFGLAVRYLGIALGYAIALGFCTAFGTLMPPIFNGQIHSIMHQTGGRVILLGVAICVVAIAVNGLAGYWKEKEVSAEERAAIGERDYSFGKGLAVAIFAGIMSSCFAYGLSAGKGIAQITRQQLVTHGRSELWQNLPVLIVVLIGGFATNLLWSVILIVRNRSAAQFVGAPGINPEAASRAERIADASADPNERLAPAVLFSNYALASLAGILWYFQFFFYSMGQTKMGKYDFSSWTLHMASIIIFATLWGLFLHEWRETSRKTRLLMALGLCLLIGSTAVVGWGNYLESLS
jgi:L-rhamnose-H+ transport protein